MTNRLGYVLAAMAVVFSCLTFVAVGLALYAARADEPYLSYPELPFVVLPPERGYFLPGDTLSYKLTRCNRSGALKSFRLAKMLVHESGLTYLLSGAVVPIAPGCVSSISTTTQLPKLTSTGVPLPPGRYRLMGASNVDGATQSFDVPWETTWFIVGDGK